MRIGKLAPADPSRAAHDATSRVGLLSGLFILTFLAFSPALENGFIDWQDPETVIDNANYRGFGRRELAWMFTTGQSGSYQPLTWLSLAADYHFWDLDPFGYHLTSLLIHCVNAVLLFLVATQLLSSHGLQRGQPITASVAWTAASVALFFSLHPLRVEAVAWISARNQVLAGCFFLCALFAYLRATGHAGGGPNYWMWMLGSFGAHVLSILSGMNGLMLPALCLLVDSFPLRRLEASGAGTLSNQITKLILEKIPFVAAGLVAIAIGLKFSAAAREQADWSISPWPERLARALYEPVLYLGKTVMPSLVSFAPLSAEDIADWQYAIFASVFVLLTLGVALLSVRHRHRFAAVAWLSYLALTLIPSVHDLESGDLGADRHSYIPSLAVAMVIGTGVGGMIDSWRKSGNRFSVALPAQGTLLVLALLAIFTWRQLDRWHDGERLWRAAVASAPESRLARKKLADLLAAQNRDGEAFEMYRQAAETHTESALAQVDFAEMLVARGRIDEAHTWFGRALKIDPHLPQALFGMGNLLAMRGDLDGAIGFYRKVLQRMPGAPFVHANLGSALARRGQLEEAVFHYRRTLQSDPDHTNAHFNLAQILSAQGKRDEATEHLRTLIKTSPGHAKAHYSLANLLMKAGDVKEATEHYQHAVKFSPDEPDAYYALGLILARQGRLDDAVAYYRHALGIRPNLADARLALARALADMGRKEDALREYQEARRLLQTAPKTLP